MRCYFVHKLPADELVTGAQHAVARTLVSDGVAMIRAPSRPTHATIPIGLPRACVASPGHPTAGHVDLFLTMEAVAQMVAYARRS